MSNTLNTSVGGCPPGSYPSARWRKYSESDKPHFRANIVTFFFSVTLTRTLIPTLRFLMRSYDFYIKDLKVTGVTRYMTITLVVRSKFTLAVVSDRYGKMLEEAFEAVLGTAVHLQFETALEAEGKNERS